jgi:hypothetical protein
MTKPPERLKGTILVIAKCAGNPSSLTQSYDGLDRLLDRLGTRRQRPSRRQIPLRERNSGLW